MNVLIFIYLFISPSRSLLFLKCQLILQAFRRFTYVTAHSPTLPSLYLRHSSFSNPSVASPTSQLIFRPFPRITYVTAHSPTLPSLHQRHSSFFNPSFASTTSQDFHLRHLASRPWCFFRLVPHYESERNLTNRPRPPVLASVCRAC